MFLLLLLFHVLFTVMLVCRVKVDHEEMAGRSLSLEVEVAGVIPAAVRAELVKELVKFVLYQRNQIPMYFDQLTDSLARESQPSVNSVIYLHLI